MLRMYSIASFAFVALAVFVPKSEAGIRPSFRLPDSAWNATDVVVAKAGEGDRPLTVLEVWKGDLKIGSEVALAKGFRAQGRTVSRDSFSIKPPSDEEPKPPTALSGDRMILFLRRANVEVPGFRQINEKGEDPIEPRSPWAPATSFGEMEVSVVWVEDGETYANLQVINPGPTLLVRYGQSEERIRKYVNDVSETQADLQEISDVQDASVRVERAVTFVLSDHAEARLQAFRILEKSGSAALPALRELLLDDRYAEVQSTVIDCMADAHQFELDGEFASYLKKDLEFWTSRGPQLEVGWWNGEGLTGEEARKLRNRYGRTLHLVYGLQETQDGLARNTVRELRQFWTSLPQLNDKSGLDQMTEACTKVLQSPTRLR